MANLYVADDGTIHSHPVSSTTNSSRTSVNVGVNSTNICEIHPVSEGRKACFWIITLIISALIGWGAYQLLGVEIFGDINVSGDALDSFFAVTAPYIMIGGSVGGCIMYGVKFASKADYNLGTYFLSALAAIGGMVALCIAVFIVAIVIMIFLYVLVIVFVIGIICAILGGS